MTMTDDLVKRLKDSAVHSYLGRSVIEEAAAKIEALTAENARLREALQIYANSCDATETSPCGYEGNMCCHTARAALNTGKEPT